MRLHHLALGARDVERVAAFYRDLLGLREITRHDDAAGALRSIWLTLGDGVLMVERTEEARTDSSAGFFLLAFRVTATEREALVARLAAAGVPVESRTEHTAYVRDPEGNQVGLSDYPLS